MRRFLQAASCFLLPCTILAGTADAQQWTRFRGPNGTGLGQAKGLPARWTESDFNWQIRLPGIGHGSPVLWGDKIFLLSADPETATRFVLCYSAVDGRQLWQREFPSQTHHLHKRNTYASSTPCVDDQRVYVAWSDPSRVTLMALDHDGNDVWDQDLGTWTSQHGFGSSPIRFEDLVILSNSQQAEQLEPGQTPGQTSLCAFDAETGKMRWRSLRKTVRVCYFTPCIGRRPDGAPELICTSTADGVYSLDPRTGEENWKVADAFRMRVVSSPLLTDGIVFGSTGSGGGGNYVAAVQTGENPRLLYQIDRSAPYVPTVVAKDGLAFLFYDKGTATCIDVRSGTVHWRERLSSGFSGSPIIAEEKLYVIDDDGNVHVLAVSKEFRDLGVNPLGEPTRSTPAVAGGRLYFRTLSRLFSLGGQTL
jgi:outer membrane protein assembly factor BamB